MKIVMRALAVLALASLGNGQGVVNGQREVLGRLSASGPNSTVDFTAAAKTAPVKTGTLAARPANCTRGELYFATDVTAGQNLYFCTTPGTPGTWTLQAGSGSASISSSLCSLASSLGFQMNGTDETTLLNAILSSSTVSCLAIDAWKTLRADGQVVASTSHPFRITGSTSAGYVLPSGSVLDLRYAGASNGGAKLFSGGGMAGTTFLEIDHITITSGGSDCNPYIISSGNRLVVHDTTFFSSHSFDTGCNDAIIQGFGSIFLGYGSWIKDNWFWGMARAYTGNSQPGWEVNAVVIENNYIQGGNATTPVDAAIKFTGSARANVVNNNLIELGYASNHHMQTCGILLSDAGVANSFAGNSAWDGDSSTYLLCGNSAAIRNKVDKSNFVDGTGSNLVNSTWSTNNYMPYRAIPFFFDGGVSALSGTTTRCGLVPFGGYINQFSMAADQAGSATITVKAVAFGSYTGPGSASDISSGGETMSGAVTKQDTALNNWSRTITPNTMVCFTLSSPSLITWLAGNVQVWEGQ